ncbi:hypothetical protein D3C71_1578250 [compost metagenome]
MPSALVTAETNTGAVVSGTVLVTPVAGRLAASLPAVSWMARPSLLPEGSVYATVTEAPLATGVSSVSTTLLPETSTSSMVAPTPLTWTTKRPATGGLAASSASL